MYSSHTVGSHKHQACSSRRNRQFQESCARDCQEIEELLRICCEETDQARQLRNPSTVSQLLTQTQDLQNKVNFLTGARELYDPETASSVPRSQPTLAYSESRELRSRDSGLPLDTRNTLGTSGTVCEKTFLLEKDHPQHSA